MKQVIYQIKNLVNGKQYIGSTLHKKKRWRVHKRMLKNNEHFNPHLQNAFNKYGADNFEFTVIEEVDESNNLLEKEQKYLDKAQPEYNIAIDTKAPMKGRSLSEKQKEKVSEASKGKNHPMYGKTGEDHPRYGKHHSKETRRKISKASKGHSALSGKNSPMYGKTGEEATGNKLTEKKVKIILHLLEAGHFYQRQIGKMFGVHFSTISAIKRGKTWPNVSIKTQGGKNE